MAVFCARLKAVEKRSGILSPEHKPLTRLIIRSFQISGNLRAKFTEIDPNNHRLSQDAKVLAALASAARSSVGRSRFCARHLAPARQSTSGKSLRAPPVG